MKAALRRSTGALANSASGSRPSFGPRPSAFGLPSTRPESGIALIIVMISVFVLTILAGGFAYSMKVETRLARNANNEAELEWLGRSGVEYARWVLAQQLNIPQEQYDALNQVWAGGTGGIGSTNSPLANVQREVHLGNGSFTWKIADLERKINVNSAGEPVLQQTLLMKGVGAGDSTPIVNSILNWIDGGTRVQGARSEYYEGLDPPYEAKNGPIDDISELLLIKGVTPELYWGEDSTNHPPAAFQPKANRFGPQNQTQPFSAGLVDVLTPLSDGRVNINTASAETLLCLPGIEDRKVAEAIVAGRQGEDDGSGMLGPYRSVQEVTRVPEVPPGLPGILQQFCDVRSRTFEVQVDAQVNGYKRQFVAILGRNSPRDVQVLCFYWK